MGYLVQTLLIVATGALLQLIIQTSWASQRIWRGVAMKPLELSSIVRIQFVTNVNGTLRTASCTGFLIHPNWYLTADHCKGTATSRNVYFGHPPNNPTIRSIDEWISAPKLYPGKSANDLALMYASSAVTEANNVSPLEIRHANFDQWTKREDLSLTLLTGNNFFQWIS